MNNTAVQETLLPQPTLPPYQQLAYQDFPVHIHDLDELMHDMFKSNPLYQPGQYWQYYTRRISRAIKKYGLTTFRSNYRFDGFVDVQIYGDYLWSYRVLRFLFNRICTPFRRLPFIGHQFSLFETIEQKIKNHYLNQIALAYNYVKFLSPNNVLDQIEDSCLGNPLFYQAPNQKRYTLDFLNKFSKYLVIKKNTDFDKINAVLELGGGFGCQAEVLLKIKPSLNYIIVDIAPQLFISQSYLSTIFKNKVLTYAETKKYSEITPELLKKLNKNIVMLASFDLHKLKISSDLFFTDYAIMEMDFDIIKNYASHIAKWVNSYIFIADKLKMLGGKNLKNLKSTVDMRDVIACFPGFKEIHRSPYGDLRRCHQPDEKTETPINVILARTP